MDKLVFSYRNLFLLIFVPALASTLMGGAPPGITVDLSTSVDTINLGDASAGDSSEARTRTLTDTVNVQDTRAVANLDVRAASRPDSIEVRNAGSADNVDVRTAGSAGSINVPRTALPIAATGDPDERIVVSIDKRRLWLIAGQDTLLSAPIAVGRSGAFHYKGETYRWATPRGQRSVRGKETDPVWVPPDWHYYEKASYRDLEPVKMQRGKKYELSDGTYLEVRGNQVGRVNRFGNFWPWTPGNELIFDGKIFIPPLDTAQRKVPNALGPYALNLGNGYLIHGTWDGNRASIGSAASHGCIRMYNEDVSKLFQMVDVGTPVVIR